MSEIKITKTEEKIISLLNLSNQEISKKLFISVATIKIHVHNLLQKFGVKNRTELFKIYQEKNKEVTQINKPDYLTLEQLANIVGLKGTTLRTYLSRSEFTKFMHRIQIDYRYKIVFLLNEDFIQELWKFLIIKKNIDGANAIKNYWSIYKKMNKKPTISNELEMVNKQYASLLKRYNEAILINKKLQVIEKICNEPADSMAVVELQNRIKDVLSE